MSTVDLFSLSESELREELTKAAKEHDISDEEVEKVIAAVLAVGKNKTSSSTLTTTERDKEEEEKEEEKIGEDGVVGGKKSRKGRKGRKGGRKTRKGGRKH